MVNAAERDRDILRHPPVDLADEADGEVQLLLVLPPRPLHAVHQRE